MTHSADSSRVSLVVNNEAEHEIEKDGTSVTESVLNVVCTTVGVGILALPNALGNAGWFGLVLIALIALFSAHTAKLLVACLHAHELAGTGRRYTSYEDVAEAAFGLGGRRLVAVLQSVTLFGVCTVFVVLIGDNMSQLVTELTLHAWILIFGMSMIPISWLKGIKEVSILAVLGVLTSFFVAGLVIVKGFQEQGNASSTPHYDFVVWRNVPRAFNLLVFSFGNHSVLPTIESAMKEPKKFDKVANWSFVIIAVIYALVGAAGYAGFGDVCALHDRVTDLFDSSSVTVKLALAVLTVHLVTAYPIPLQPLILALEAAMGLNDHNHGKSEPSDAAGYSALPARGSDGGRVILSGHATSVHFGGPISLLLTPASSSSSASRSRCSHLARYIVRSALVAMTVLTATVIPYFGDIMVLISALTIVAVAFLLPPVLFYRLFHQSKLQPLGAAHLAFLVLIVLVGLAGAGTGLYYGVKQLIDDINSNPNPFSHFF